LRRRATPRTKLLEELRRRRVKTVGRSSRPRGTPAGRPTPAGPPTSRTCLLVPHEHGPLAREHACRERRELERREATRVDPDKSLRKQLPHDAAPLGLREILADPEGRQAGVTELVDARGLLAAQDVDDVPRAEVLPTLPLETHHG